MAAKCAYIERVGSVYYVRRRIPRAWDARAGEGVMRMSLRTKDRATAIRRGLEALAVFEELLRMEPKDALMHLTCKLIDEQMLKPEAMTGDDLVRRRALGSVGAKVIMQARQELNIGENLDGIYQELVYFNQATVEGEAVFSRQPVNDLSRCHTSKKDIAFSTFDVVQDELGTSTPSSQRFSEIMDTSPVAHPKRPEVVQSVVPALPVVADAAPSFRYTLRYLMDDYFRRDGKLTGADNRSNVERAVKLFEDLCPEVKTVPVMQLPLEVWDQLYEFVQEIPLLRGRGTPSDLVGFTRQIKEQGDEYPRLSAATINSNYLGAITRMVSHGNRRHFFMWQAPPMVVSERKRVTTTKAKATFSPEEIGLITSCPVYCGSASRHHRYAPGRHIYADDHVYWAPLIAIHTGMRVTEIGLLRFEQLQLWFGQPTLVLEIEGEGAISAGEVGYKTGNAIRRIPIHPQLVDLGFLDFWRAQEGTGKKVLFPNWTQHVKGGISGRPEVHYEADFFNANRAKWGVPAHRKARLTFHSFRGYFIQSCHAGGVNPYTVLKYVGHDEDTEKRTNSVHRNYLDQDLTEEEVDDIAKVRIPLGPIVPYRQLINLA